ncbi:uncharacterized protein LOC144360418, partial [Saccoglossus kowalevskii]
MYGMDEDIPSSNPNPWHPFPNEHYAELSCLINAPRPLGDANLQFIFHLLRKHDPSTPSYYQVKQMCAKLPGRLEPNMFVDSNGKSYHSLSIIDVIRQRMATPDTAARLARYPQKPLDGVIREMYQSQKWMLNRQYHTPMIKEHEQDFFVKDFVWVTYKSKKILGYISAIFTETSLEEPNSFQTFAKLIVCKLYENKYLCLTDDTIKVRTQHLVCRYEGPLDNDVLGWKLSNQSVLERLSKNSCKSLCEGNILRKNARGKKVVSVLVVLFSDDVGGSTTNKWNSFSEWCLLLGGLPKKDNNKLQNILFLNASNSVSALELSKPLVSELKILERSGVVMYDAYLKEEVLVLSPVILIKADKRQSELVNHLGACATKFCQKCTVTQVDDDVTHSADVRSKDYV